MSQRQQGNRQGSQSKYDEKQEEQIKHLQAALRDSKVKLFFPYCAYLLEKHGYDYDKAYEEAIQPGFVAPQKQYTKYDKPRRNGEVVILFGKEEKPKEEKPVEYQIDIAPEETATAKQPEQKVEEVPISKPAKAQPAPQPQSEPVPVAAPVAAPVVSANPVVYDQNAQKMMQMPLPPAMSVGYFQPIPVFGQVCMMPVPPGFYIPPGYILVVPVAMPAQYQ